MKTALLLWALSGGSATDSALLASVDAGSAAPSLVENVEARRSNIKEVPVVRAFTELCTDGVEIERRSSETRDLRFRITPGRSGVRLGLRF